MDEVYYKQSGKFTAGNLLGTFLFCVIVSVIFAFIYSLINRYNPFAYVQVIATVIFAILLGIMNAQILEIGKVRNISINVIYGLIMSLIALYFSWTFWLFEIFNYKYELLRIVTSPLIDWQVITDISKVGTKTFRGTELKGTTLWGVWFIEASIIVIGVIYYSVKDQSCKVFCENCATWCKIAKGFDLVGQIELDSLKRATEAKNFSYLEKLSLKPNQVNSWLNLYIRKCPNCENTNTLSISEINRETNFQGKTSIKEKDLLINLLVSSKEVSKIEEICDKAQKYSNAN